MIELPTAYVIAKVDRETRLVTEPRLVDAYAPGEFSASGEVCVAHLPTSLAEMFITKINLWNVTGRKVYTSAAFETATGHVEADGDTFWNSWANDFIAWMNGGTFNRINDGQPKEM